MIKIKAIVLVFITLLLFSSTIYAAPLLDSEEIEAEGPVEAYDAGSVTVEGTTFTVNEDTIIITGRGRGTAVDMDELTLGVWISVSGYTDEDGIVTANKVRIKPWVDAEIESDEDPEDEEEDSPLLKPKHPIALWLVKRFDLKYEELMAMHEAGIGWGNMVKSYHLARANPQLGVSGKELLDLHLEGKGWGNITRELGTKPGKTPPAWGRDKDRPHPNPNAGPKKDK
jgi:hypothetical protein